MAGWLEVNKPSSRKLQGGSDVHQFGGWALNPVVKSSSLFRSPLSHPFPAIAFIFAVTNLFLCADLSSGSLVWKDLPLLERPFCCHTSILLSVPISGPSYTFKINRVWTGMWWGKSLMGRLTHSSLVQNSGLFLRHRDGTRKGKYWMGWKPVQSKWEKYSCELSVAKKQFQANSLDSSQHHNCTSCPATMSNPSQWGGWADYKPKGIIRWSYEIDLNQGSSQHVWAGKSGYQLKESWISSSGIQDTPRPARMYTQLRFYLLEWRQTATGIVQEETTWIVRNSGPYSCSFNLFITRG